MKTEVAGIFISVTLSQLFYQTLQDSSGCSRGHKSVTAPYLTDVSGKFISYKLQDDNQTTSQKVFLAIPWGKERLLLVLERHEITPTTSTVEWRDDRNITNIEHLRTDEERLYQGYVRGRHFSFVALSIKEGLTGYIFIDGVGVYIEPLERNEAVTTSFMPHLLHSCTRHKQYAEDQNHTPLLSEVSSLTRQASRHRRASPGSFTKYLEVLVVADTTVVNFVGNDKIKSYILGLMNIANAVYHDISLGATIEVVTTKIMYMDKASEDRVISLSDPKRTVDQFCQWASTKTYRTSYYDTGVTHDVAVLLTRNKFAPAGYAPITGMCVPMRNCALVKDDGFTSAFVIAHEIGHVFGLFHDGQGNSCYGKEYSNSVMATMVQSSFHHFWWSECSRTRMAEVLPGLRCLNNNPYEKVNSDIALPVGISWSLNEQCRLEFGEKASHCRIFPHLDPCAQLWCGEGPGTYQCKTKNVVPLDGSQCGPTDQWYCLNGSCGYHGDQAPIHGGWSDWSGWSQCSSGCGIGFKRRSRRCDNPVPEYGGKDCDGEGENSDTCMSEECTDYVDMRATQCSIMDIVQVRQGTHSWKPYQAEKAEDYCKLTCVSSTSGEVVSFDTLVDNGTPCTYDEPNSICLDGSCINVGCDGVRNSSLKEDRCGVCGGDSTSCKVVEGVYKKHFKYSAADGYYETVLVLPKGSRDIVISESNQSPHFLAVRDAVYYQYVLNGNGRQYPSKNFAVDGAWFKYNNDGGQEKLTSKGPVHNKVNIMIYPMDWQKPASVEFRYTVDKNDFTYEMNKFTWKYEDWSPCSVSCGKGVQRIVYGCYDKVEEEKVDDEKCQFIEEPDREDIECERIRCEDLDYRWRMSRGWSPCSATCGNDGVQHQLYVCESVKSEKEMEKEFCKNIPEPVILQSCNIQPCQNASYRWVVTSEWSPCSATCGDKGFQYQLYYCVKELNDAEEIKVDDIFCSDMTDPKEPRKCNTIPCVEYAWVESDEWQDCTEECGDNGVQRKKVECQRRIGEEVTPVGVRHCFDLEKPSESRICNRIPCFTYRWRTEQWSDCSTSCGDGFKKKLTVCYNVTYDNRDVQVEGKHCNVSERPVVTATCNKGPCVAFEWVLTDEWTDCSAECGIAGIQARKSECHEIREGNTNIVNDSFCSKQNIDTQTIPCNRKPCYSFEWNFDEWSSCSVSCTSNDSTSIRTRKVWCVQKYTNGQFEVTEPLFCDNRSRPIGEQICDVQQCSFYRWDESEVWSDCSVTCGNAGFQINFRQCVKFFYNGTSTPVNAIFCANISVSKEPAKRTCNLPPCPNYRYKALDPSSLGTCSVSCGIGVYEQPQQCVHLSDDGLEETVNLSYCEKLNLSPPKRECNMGPCEFLEWGAGEWSMCSKTCGPGKRKRIVYCGDPTRPSDVRSCPGKAPDEYEDCNEGICTGISGQCGGDRAPFCRNATLRLCHHPSYYRACCASCDRQSQSQPRPFYRYIYTNYLNRGR